MLWGERLICLDFVVVVIGLMFFFVEIVWSVFCLFFQKRGNFPIQNLFCFIQKKTKLKLAIFSGWSAPKGSILLVLFFHGRHCSLMPPF